jgi:hypothetical protein
LEEELQQAKALISELRREIQTKDELLLAKDAVIQSKEAALQFVIQSGNDVRAMKDALLQKDDEMRLLRAGSACAAATAAPLPRQERGAGCAVAASEEKASDDPPAADEVARGKKAAETMLQHPRPGRATAALAGTEFRRVQPPPRSSQNCGG